MSRAGLLLLPILAACGAEPTIDRIQPDRIPKSQFQGEWYFRQTLIDVPYETSITREGFATKLERIRFVIDESTLIAYRATEHVLGAGESGELEPVAAWPIRKHFDVVTEKQGDRKVRIEDDVSRPWWERPYVHVDFGRDVLLRAPDLAPLPGEIVSSSQADSYVQSHDDGDPDRLEITPDAMNIVGVYHLAPDPAACARFVDAVWGTGDTSACAATTVKRRTSFLRIRPDAPPVTTISYPDLGPVAADLDGDHAIGPGEQLGSVLSICAWADADGQCQYADGVRQTVEVECTPEVLQALARDPFYGRFHYGPEDCSVPQEAYFGRFGFARTERPVLDPGTGLVQPVQLIDRWNVWERSFDAQGKPIPYADRTPRPVVMYASVNFPPELLPEVQAAAGEWGRALLETVAALQGRSLESYGDLQMLEIRPNHGEKPGDLRHSMIVWVDRPQQDAPVGLASAAADPITGEIVAAQVYLYAAPLERQAVMATDIVRLIRGDLDVSDVIRGEELRQRIAAARAPPVDEDRLEQAVQELQRRAAGAPPPGSGSAQARLDKLAADPDLERALVDDEDLRATGWRPGDEVTADLVERTSPRTRGARSEARHDALRHLGSGDCLLEQSFTDPGAVGLAVDYDAGDLGRDDVLRDLRGKILRGIVLHELGHVLGLRHNFAGSWDALNYHERFWEIRRAYQDDIQKTLDSGLAVGDDATTLQRCLDSAESWQLEPPTTGQCLHEAELKTSSVMDYAARFNARFGGLGRYDRAAIRFGYGLLLDVFQNEDLTPIGIANNLVLQDYSKIPLWLGPDVRSLVRLPDRMKARLERAHAASQALPILDPKTGACVRNCEVPASELAEVPYRFCSDELVDLGPLDCHRWDEGANAEEMIDAAIRRSEVQGLFAAFRRGRLDWEPEDYLRDLRERTLAPIAWTARSYLWLGQFYPDWDLGQDQARATFKGVNHLLGMVVNPLQPGWYCNLGGVFRPCTEASPGEKVEIPGSALRGYWSTYDGGYHSEQESVGTGRDAREALRVLTDNAGSTGVYEIFQEQVIDALASLIAANPTAPSAWVIRTPEGLAVIGGPPSGDVVGPLFSQVAYDDELAALAATYAFTGLSSPDDGIADASDYLFVALKGAPDDIEFAGIDRTNPAQYLELEDPLSHEVYVTVNTADGRSITHRMLSAGWDVLEHQWKPAKEELDATEPGSQRHLQAKAELDQADVQLRRILGGLDRIRALRRLYVP